MKKEILIEPTMQFGDCGANPIDHVRIKNKETIIEHVSRESEPQTPMEKRMYEAMQKAFEATGGLEEPDDDDI